MKYFIIVVGPAGCGKTTLCKNMREILLSMKRCCYIIDLDFGSIDHKFVPDIDIKNIFNAYSIMKQYKLGFNGALIKCLSLMEDNYNWLLDQCESFSDNSFFIIDTVGQSELFLRDNSYTKLINQLKCTNGRCCVVSCIEFHFFTTPSRQLAGGLLSLASSIVCESPTITILTKSDMLRNQFGIFEPEEQKDSDSKENSDSFDSELSE